MKFMVRFVCLCLLAVLPAFACAGEGERESLPAFPGRRGSAQRLSGDAGAG
jgi:hypothetical protein